METGLAWTYAFATDHNVDGSLRSQDYPAAGGLQLESVQHHYDETTGLPTHSSSSFNAAPVSYVADTVYNELGQVNQLTLYTGKYDGLGSRVYIREYRGRDASGDERTAMAAGSIPYAPPETAHRWPVSDVPGVSRATRPDTNRLSKVGWTLTARGRRRMKLSLTGGRCIMGGN